MLRVAIKQKILGITVDLREGPRRKIIACTCMPELEAIVPHYIDVADGMFETMEMDFSRSRVRG